MATLEIDVWGLLDKVEEARFGFWCAARYDQAKADRMLADYMAQPFDYLVDLADRRHDRLAAAALVLMNEKEA